MPAIKYIIVSKKEAITILLMLYASFSSTFSIADVSTDTQIGRYMTVPNNPSISQVNLLSQTIQIHFPQNIQTVGDAMNYMLRLSGYSLIPVNQMGPSLKITLSKPLPAIDRDLGPISLSTALTLLAGPPFYLVNDPINRMIDFHLKSQYAQIYQNNMKK